MPSPRDASPRSTETARTNSPARYPLDETREPNPAASHRLTSPHQSCPGILCCACAPENCASADTAVPCRSHGRRPCGDVLTVSGNSPRSVWLTRPCAYAKISLLSLSGSNSVVECNLAKVDVAGSNPVSRSIFLTADLDKQSARLRARGPLAQVVEQGTLNPKVGRSSRPRPTNQIKDLRKKV